MHSTEATMHSNSFGGNRDAEYKHFTSSPAGPASGGPGPCCRAVLRDSRRLDLCTNPAGPAFKQRAPHKPCCPIRTPAQLLVQALRWPDRPGGRAPFAALSCMLLGSNAISSWASVDELDRFPALADTRLAGNPLLAAAQGGGRFEVRKRIFGDMAGRRDGCDWSSVWFKFGQGMLFSCCVDACRQSIEVRHQYLRALTICPIHLWWAR